METRVYAAYDDGLRIVDPETGTVSHRLADRAVECLSVVSGGTESGGTGGDGECIDGDGSGGDGSGGDESRGDESRGDGSKRDRSAGARVLAGTFDAGLFRSTDGGGSFERVATESLGPGGSGSEAVTAVATSPHDPEVVWIGTEPSRVYRSTDGGETVERIGGLTEVPSASEWSFPPRPDTHHVRWIEPCPADPERWFVGV